MRFKSKQLLTQNSMSLDITPLIDVVLNLLIFFMLSSTFVMQEAITLQLPQANTATTVDPNLVTVQITRDDQLLVDGSPVSLEELRGRLTARYNPQNPPVLYLMADKDVYYSRPIEVLDMAREIGYQKLGLATQQGSALENTEREREEQEQMKSTEGQAPKMPPPPAPAPPPARPPR